MDSGPAQRLVILIVLTITALSVLLLARQIGAAAASPGATGGLPAVGPSPAFLNRSQAL